MWGDMQGFKEECLSLRRAGHTLSEIMKITKRSKTTVHFHIKNLPLPENRLRQINLERSLRAKEIARLRKGKSDRGFKKFEKWNAATVSLLSHLIFDGSISKTSCTYNNRNMVLLSHVEKCMKTLYKFEPRSWKNEATGVNRISYHNVALANYLNQKAGFMLKEIDGLPKKLKKEFIKAFFNDEGCMDFRPKRNLRQIRGYQKNISSLLLIQALLKDFSIDSKVVRPNEIVISKKDNLLRFRKEINFSEGVKLNENRSNSIWKKPLEKSMLLNMAIASFKN